MIGHEDENEEVHYKVADKRKFNADGSLREGVTLEPQKDEVKPQETAGDAQKPAQPVAEAQSAPDQRDAKNVNGPVSESTTGEANEIVPDEIPGAEDPASFVNFLSMLATNAATALGAIPNPATGQRSLDLETGKYWLDILGMIKEKTKGNLHPQEAKVVESLLGDLRMQYVHLVRATEERLKAQAAQQFSGADILGNKVD